ncbi:MAG: hypothetical protein ACOZB3_11695 [Calditrichota bacterium]
MNKKKLIMAVGLFLGSFIVINVGMFFFLKMTTPKIGPRADVPVAAHSDSLHHADSTMAMMDSTHVDSTVVEHPDSTLAESTPADTVDEMQPVVLAENAEPKAVETVIEAPKPEPLADTTSALSEAPRKQAEATVQAVAEGDVREMAKLAKLLEAMKPADAAAIATRLNTDQIIALVMRMKDRTAGKMLAELPVEQAARVAARMSQTASRARGGS